MRVQCYRLIRDLHLYIGLFISPFVLLFAISVFFLVHSWLPRLASVTTTTRVVSDLPLPGDLPTLSGRPLIDSLKPAPEKADVRGEVGFVRHLVKEQKLIIPVTIPGRETTVSINIANREATIVTSETGLAVALVTLNRPEALNALSRALRAALHDALVDLAADPAVSVIVLTGAGRAFTAGLDLKELGSDPAGMGAANARGGDENRHRAADDPGRHAGEAVWLLKERARHTIITNG